MPSIIDMVLVAESTVLANVISWKINVHFMFTTKFYKLHLCTVQNNNIMIFVWFVDLYM